MHSVGDVFQNGQEGERLCSGSRLDVTRECKEYTGKIGIEEEVSKATRQLAEWSAAAECRMYSMVGVMCKEMPTKELRKVCRRGLPWTHKMVRVGDEKRRTSWT